MIVADASAIVHALVADGGAAGQAIDQLVSHEVHCPSHVDAEVGQALRRLALGRPTAALQAERALMRASQWISVRHEAPGFLTSCAWALRERISFYDGLYVALAVALDAPLLTADARLAGAQLPCRVELVA